MTKKVSLDYIFVNLGKIIYRLPGSLDLEIVY